MCFLYLSNQSSGPRLLTTGLIFLPNVNPDDQQSDGFLAQISSFFILLVKLVTITKQLILQNIKQHFYFGDTTVSVGLKRSWKKRSVFLFQNYNGLFCVSR